MFILNRRVDLVSWHMRFSDWTAQCVLGGNLNINQSEDSLCTQAQPLDLDDASLRYTSSTECNVLMYFSAFSMLFSNNKVVQIYTYLL